MTDNRLSYFCCRFRPISAISFIYSSLPIPLDKVCFLALLFSVSLSLSVYVEAVSFPFGSQINFNFRFSYSHCVVLLLFDSFLFLFCVTILLFCLLFLPCGDCCLLLSSRGRCSVLVSCSSPLRPARYALGTKRMKCFNCPLLPALP